MSYGTAPTLREHYARRAVIAAGFNAAETLRKAIKRAVNATCANCGFDYLPSAVDIDHIQPLALGGEDVPSNVQVLCRPCHKAKTRVDFQHSTPPF